MGAQPKRRITMSAKKAAVTCLLLGIGLLSFTGVEAKKWTVTQRQQRLSGEINSAFKANQLTLEESESLRRECDKVTEQEQKMKEKNGGKLSYSDDTQLERNLNKISNKLHKKMLEKRVQ
jgi:hypothetical protein